MFFWELWGKPLSVDQGQRIREGRADFGSLIINETLGIRWGKTIQWRTRVLELSTFPETGNILSYCLPYAVSYPCPSKV